MAAAPDAEAVMHYGMPGFRIDGTVIAGFAAFTNQCGLYVSPGSIAWSAEDLEAAGLRPTKTGVTFDAKRPLPSALVRALELASRADASR